MKTFEIIISYEVSATDFDSALDLASNACGIIDKSFNTQSEAEVNEI